MIVALHIPLLFLDCLVLDGAKGGIIVALPIPLVLLACMVSDGADPVVLLERYLERGIIIFAVGANAAFPPQRGFASQARLGET
jgi:hypothetical protein